MLSRLDAGRPRFFVPMSLILVVAVVAPSASRVDAAAAAATIDGRDLDWRYASVESFDVSVAKSWDVTRVA